MWVDDNNHCLPSLLIDILDVINTTHSSFYYKYLHEPRGYNVSIIYTHNDIVVANLKFFIANDDPQ